MSTWEAIDKKLCKSAWPTTAAQFLSLYKTINILFHHFSEHKHMFLHVLNLSVCLWYIKILQLYTTVYAKQGGWVAVV